MVHFCDSVADEQMFTSYRDRKGDKVIPNWEDQSICAHVNLQSGSWYQADVEIYFTTTMPLWKEAYLVEDYSKYLNEVYGFHTFRKTSISHPTRMCVSTVCSSSLRRASWELSCQPFPDYLPLCHGFPVVISSKWSAQCTYDVPVQL